MQDSSLIYEDYELRCSIHTDRIFTPRGNFDTRSLVGADIKEKTHTAKTASTLLELGAGLVLLIGFGFRSNQFYNTFWLLCAFSVFLFLVSRMLKIFDIEYEVSIYLFIERDLPNKKVVIAVCDSKIQAERLVNVLKYAIGITKKMEIIIPYRHKYDELLGGFLKYSNVPGILR